MFLAIIKNRVIDVVGQPAVAEVVGVPPQPGLEERRDADGNITQEFRPERPAIEAVAAADAVPEEAHFEFNRMYLDNDVRSIAAQIERGDYIDYYSVEVNGLVPSLVPATIKSGPRRREPAREIIDIEAGGRVVGSAIIDA